MLRRKNILKRLDYDNLKTVHSEFLPPIFDGDVMFVFPLVSSSATQSKSWISGMMVMFGRSS